MATMAPVGRIGNPEEPLAPLLDPLAPELLVELADPEPDVEPVEPELFDELLVPEPEVLAPVEVPDALEAPVPLLGGAVGPEPDVSTTEACAVEPPAPQPATVNAHIENAAVKRVERKTITGFTSKRFSLEHQGKTGLIREVFKFVQLLCNLWKTPLL